MPRRRWEDLPEQAHAAVAEHTGPVLAAGTAPGGQNSAIAATLTTRGGLVFVKGIATDHPQWVAQDREAAVNHLLPPSCPRLLWRVQTAGWDLLGYEHIPHPRHADYRPGSPDLELVAAVVTELQDITVADRPAALKTARARWGKHLPDPEVLDGETLLHTDLAPHNLLITDGRARLIDWAWPTVGPAWIDPAMLILRMLQAGWAVGDAHLWARGRFPSWRDADPDARAAFTRANAGVWAEISHADPVLEWKARMAALAADLAANCAA